ncbi:ATP-binding cassette domain-containing protein [Sphingobacterium lactis]|uniref:ATP-binding cassette domain-containing protein n=1 Tax=Sphingobacterium lactis TaxID=797291 RepID=UPI003F7E4CB6
MLKESKEWLHSYIASIKKYWILGAIFTLLGSICFVAFAFSISQFLHLWLNKTIEAYYLYLAVVAVILRYIFNYFSQLYNELAGEKSMLSMQADFLQASLNNQQVKPSEAVHIYSDLLEDTKPYFSNFIPTGIASVLVSGALILVFFYIDPIVGGILLLSLLLIPLQMIAVGYGAESIHQKNIQLFLRYSSVFYNRIQSITSIQNLGKLKQQEEFIQEKSTEVNEANMKVMHVAMLSSTLMEFFITFSIAIVALYLGLSLLDYLPFHERGAGYHFGNAMFLLMLTPFYYVYLRKFVSAYHDRNKAIAVAEQAYEIIKEQSFPTVTSSKELIENSMFSNIYVQNLSFQYQRQGQMVLQDLNFDLPNKGLVWLKGISGSGKSTLLKLLTGYLNPSSGTITLDNYSEEETEEWLLKNTGYFNQHTFVFTDTIRKNIALNQDLSAKEWTELLNFSGFQQVLTSNQWDLDVKLTNNAIQLSAGQKQLLGFARLLAEQKPVLLLDEPTANLDAQSEEVLFHKLKELSKTKLVILATHQTSVKELADFQLELSLGSQIHFS